MNDSQMDQKKRWFRVVATCPINRLVDIQATSESEAQEIADALGDHQFIQTDEDDWIQDSLTEISEDEVMHPLN